MKKSIISPLFSAIIIPGFGQILNHQLKKGGFFLASVFLLFLAALIKLIFTLHQATLNQQPTQGQTGILSAMNTAEDLSFLWILIIPFALLWLYSIVDAFLVGRKLDRLEE